MMHFVSSALAAAAFVSTALAGPIEERGAPTIKAPHLQTFSVKQVGAGIRAKPAPAVNMLHTYQKFGKAAQAPVRVRQAAKKRKTVGVTGSVAANPQAYDMAYLSPVNVGGTWMNLDFDTGSSDLWVYSSLMSAKDQAGRTVYTPGPNAKLMSGYQWQISYGDGSGAAGKVYADKVVIGGVTATSQAVEAATSASSGFLSDYQNEGLVGLAFSNLNTVRPQQQTTFFDSVKTTLAASLFTCTLKKGQPGTYDFGFVNASKYTGPMIYAPIKSYTGFWMFTMGGSKIGGGQRNYTSMGDAIADTGTTLAYLPDDRVQAYYAQVNGAVLSSDAGGWIFPCNAKLPTFSIGIRGTLFPIVSMTYFMDLPGSVINYQPVSNTMCFGGIQSNSGIGFSILGDVFLKTVFAVFDQSQKSPRIGFAKQA